MVLNGHFLKSDRDWFLLPVESRERLSMGVLPRETLPVSTLMTMLADKPRERSVMVLGTARRRGEVTPYLERGLVDLSEDQGHVLIGGAADVADDFARDVLAVPGERFGARDARERRLALSGLTDESMAFIPEGRELRAVPEPEPEPEPEREPRPQREDGARQADRDYWEAIRAIDSERGYINYLDRFPDGAYAQEASERLDAVRRDPSRRAAEGEDDLNLGREDRRRIQTALSILGFDPRGIDGIFGPGTRAALSAWQRDNRFEATGFLTADQIARMSEQAGRRAAEMEAEAEAQRAEARRLDTAYWSQTGEGGGAAGLQAYLERYPDGLFADRARDRLSAIERDARSSAALADARDWDEARAEDRMDAYRRYMERNPDGAFVEAARARIGELEGEARDIERQEAARAAEEGLGLTGVTRGLVEGRLEAFGFEPGAVDGRFDRETRRAIRRYQRSRGLEPTGYLDQGAVVQILADSILR